MEENIGTRIHKRRVELGMTLAELGRLVNTGTSTVRKWETGYIKDMRSDKILKVANALEVSPCFIMGWEEDASVNVNTVNGNNGIIGHANAPVTINSGPPELSKEEQEILRIYGVLSVKGRVALLTKALALEEQEK